MRVNSYIFKVGFLVLVSCVISVCCISSSYAANKATYYKGEVHEYPKDKKEYHKKVQESSKGTTCDVWYFDKRYFVPIAYGLKEWRLNTGGQKLEVKKTKSGSVQVGTALSTSVGISEVVECSVKSELTASKAYTFSAETTDTYDLNKYEKNKLYNIGHFEYIYCFDHVNTFYPGMVSKGGKKKEKHTYEYAYSKSKPKVVALVYRNK